MKRNQDDEKLAKLLKQNSFQEEENEWFTPRVLNRLPEKQHSTGWMKRLLYCIVFIGCIVGWVWMYKTADFSVITVRDLLNVALMGLANIIVIAAAVVDFMKDE